MFELVKHYRHRWSAGHEKLKTTYCLYVCSDSPSLPEVQLHETEGVLVYMPMAWLAVSGTPDSGYSIRIRPHDGFGKPREDGSVNVVIDQEGAVRCSAG